MLVFFFRFSAVGARYRTRAESPMAVPKWPENEEALCQGQGEMSVSPKPLKSRKNQC
jgi:hypothetical protein